jgi:hypothetical protein
MPHFPFGPRAFVALSGALALLVAATVGVSGAGPRQSPPATNCTVAYAADDSGAYGGNNEDEVNPLTEIWFVPGEGDGYGSMFVGYDDLVIQGGMNEAGLFYDGLGVREVETPGTPGKPEYTGQNFFVDMLSECDSVACVLERYGGLSMPGTWNGQVLFGDRYGDSVIFEPLAVIPQAGHFQVATNLFQSEIPLADRTDERYLTATSMLADADTLSVDLMREVMEATHQEGTVNTVYSTVYDLQAGVIHLYYFNDFTTEVTFNLREELVQGLHGYEMADLFPANRSAADVAAPFRARLSTAIDRLGPVIVAGDDLEDLAGTYEVGPLAFVVKATDQGLAIRQARTPWADVVSLSPTQFARVTVDGGGLLHEQHLTFSVDGGLTSVEISEDQVGSVVATRLKEPGGPIDWRPAAILTALASVGGVTWWRIATRRPRASAVRLAGGHRS